VLGGAPAGVGLAPAKARARRDRLHWRRQREREAERTGAKDLGGHKAGPSESRDDAEHVPGETS
jgi:hypothetical protein